MQLTGVRKKKLPKILQKLKVAIHLVAIQKEIMAFT